MRSVFLLVILIAITLSAQTRDNGAVDAPAAGFTPVTPGRILTFPADHRLHHDFQTEWWYLTANLEDAQGNHYGAQFTLFTALDDYAKPERRIFFAHAALSTAEAFYFSERYARADMGHAGVTASPWRAHLDHWEFKGAATSPLPGAVKVAERDFAYQLSLSDADYFLQDDRGFSARNTSGSIASYHYSAPFIQTTGSLTVSGKPIEVTGKAWLDREWSNKVMASAKLGWDWLALHLSDRSALMLYRIRIEGETRFNASLMHDDGRVRGLDTDAIIWRAQDHMEFDGIHYPISSRLEIPQLDLDITIRPINSRQYLATLVPYWEGAIVTSGTHTARGYLELFGVRE